MSVDTPSDTSPDAARVRLDLLRRTSVERRLQGCLSWSRSMIALSRAGTQSRMPAATDAQVAVAWVDANYGRDLARRVAERIGVSCPTGAPSSS